VALRLKFAPRPLRDCDVHRAEQPRVRTARADVEHEFPSVPALGPTKTGDPYEARIPAWRQSQLSFSCSNWADLSDGWITRRDDYHGLPSRRTNWRVRRISMRRAQRQGASLGPCWSGVRQRFRPEAVLSVPARGLRYILRPEQPPLQVVCLTARQKPA
jgi:hypothetical protein